MYLKRLELQGYKTFATRTEFEFDAGITAIVGPNGSGKSNIADALRWVMGEQRYSALRARRSEDMIFAGSEGRTSVGMADVSLTLDNSGKWLPIDYSEVTVQRRAFRSGENQYYLNGSRVRRRDIVELLAKGGVSSNTYTIIAQGAVDASLSMRPEERRAIFEEAAGIAIHQAKRDLSLAKLEETRSNILRVNDIINELTPRLERLNKQAERAKEYQKVSRELEKLLETWYGYRWRQAQERSHAAGAELEERQQALSRHKHVLEDTSRQIDQLRKRQAELRGDLGRWHSESGALHGRLEELERQLAVKRERHRLIGQRRDEIQQEISPLAASREAALERIAELESELDSVEEELTQRKREREDLQAQLSTLEEERDRLEEELAGARESAFELATALAERRNLLAQLGERREELEEQTGQHERAIAQLKAQLNELTEQVDALEGERDSISTTLERLGAEAQEKQSIAQVSVERQAELRARLEGLRQIMGKLETRYDLLSRLRRELAGYSEGVRTILNHRGDLKGIKGTVAELVEVPSTLEDAVEAALGSLLQGIVVETWRDAQAALRFLKDGEAGRATFIPLDSLSSSSADNVPQGDGIVGLASNLVRTQEGLEDVLRALLGHTLVVEDLGTARQVRKAHTGLHLVTVAGEFVSEQGFVRGGAEGSGGGLLGRERERRQLPEEISALRANIEGLEHELAEEETLHGNLLAETATLEQDMDSQAQALKATDEEIDSRHLEAERVSQEIEWHRIAQRRIRDEIRQLEDKERALDREVAVAEAEQRDVGEMIDALQDRVASLDPLTLQEKLAGLRTATAVLERGKETHESTLEGHKSTLEQLRSQLAAKESRVAELTAEQEELADTITALTAQTDQLSNQVEDLSGQIGPAEREMSHLESEQLRLEDEERKGRLELDTYEAAHNRSVLQAQRREDEARNLRERIQADLEMIAVSADRSGQLPLDVDARLKSLPVVTEMPRGLEEKIKRKRARLREVGSVDLDALSEYQEVLERYNFLMGQVEDLEKARQSLRKVIVELDRLMEEKFLETLGRVAEEFEIYFTRLFNGGTGRLELTDHDRPLEAGVEILAQPPGRRNRSVDTLSGGERALTGVALTFAILKACGTPFCLLDEVDSRLDEINIGRFRQAVSELGERTQVIIITHNRGSLEISDTIYGVTMGQDSASRVLSLRLEDVDAQAS